LKKRNIPNFVKETKILVFMKGGKLDRWPVNDQGGAYERNYLGPSGGGWIR
jgi:hypothetical protein